jgi:hypothetical protein
LGGESFVRAAVAEVGLQIGKAALKGSLAGGLVSVEVAAASASVETLRYDIYAVLSRGRGY